MSFADALRKGFGISVKSSALEVSTNGPVLLDTSMSVEYVLGMGPEELWRTQPYLRTVVTFIARNIAQLGLHVFERVSETDRRRVRDNPVASLLSRPNSGTTGYELIYGLVADMALYDRAYWLLVADDSPSGWSLTRIPPSWIVAVKGGGLFEPATYVVQKPDAAPRIEIPADKILAFHGWSPDSLRSGSSPVNALKQILSEQVEAQSYRLQVWRRGGRVSSVLTRPAGTQWSPEASERFKKDWRSRWTDRDGTDAGGTPILEDGMTLQRLGFSAHEDEFIEAAKLALTVTASVYHLNPTMIGLLDSANYSNVREFRKMLYGDSLGPILAQIEDRVNTFLVPKVSTTSGIYTEFNIAEKLQGSFEEQAAALQSSTGAPWMLRSEARARMNLPEVPNSDELVVPLNVLVGGQASPNNSAPKSGVVQFKARAPKPYEEKYAEVVGKFFARQKRVVQTALGVKAGEDWWDADRWDAELSGDLYRLAVQVTKQVSAVTLDEIGFDPDEYDVDRTLAWLKAVSERSAASINEATKSQVVAALGAEDPAAAVTSVFDVAEGQRAGAVATTAVTMLSAFAAQEAATQLVGEKATKTWVTGPKARPSHAAMNGETVALSEDFSNGLPWPGAAGDSDEVAGCNCSLSINTP